MAEGERGLEFEVEVSESETRYHITARSSIGGEGVADAGRTPDGLLLGQRLQRLRIALLSSAVPRRRVPSNDEAAVQQLGKALFDKLFIDEVRYLFDTTRQQAAQQNRPLRLVLRFRSPEFAALPWEFLYDARRDDYLSLSMPLVRYAEIPETVRPLLVAPPLRILGMSARPAQFDALDVEAEKTRLQRALSHLVRDRLVELTWVRGETWRDLVHALDSGRWHVLHLVAHGAFDEVAKEGVIYLPGEDGTTYGLRASLLARVVSLHPSLRLVSLNACESAMASTTDLFSSSASTLVRRGVPAVLAMQFEITDDAAIEFTSSFYEGLASGRPIDVAVRNARLELSLARPYSLEWGTPVLHLRQSDGRIFDVLPKRPPRRPGTRPEPPGAVGARAEPSRVSGVGDGPSRVAVRAPAAARRAAAATAPPPAVRGDGGREGWTRRSRRPLVIGASAVCVLGAVLFTLVTSAADEHGAGSATVRVDASSSWTASGVRLKAGQRYEIEATGEISPVPGARNGPEGEAGHGDDAMAVLDRANFAALLARIGDRGAPFLVGGGAKGSATTSGELSLGLNDRNPDDNTGALTVRIRLFD
ncbi:CHAT domain-containing protein [Streptomyces sp. CRN 30]|uniref:CHAT domain-containing protein n=1 Tax=Streptomyces sp. CRN 30 TaxID=3075613 RepID=UPI002A82D2F4|nr:CHAT domain-containing protein [Streptomyces sp. CRN 30]